MRVPEDTRPTMPVTIGDTVHQIHVKPVLGEAGPFDLYDIWEVHAAMTSGIYTDNIDRDPIRWRHFRQWHQNGPGMYSRFQMASFWLESDVQRIPNYNRKYVTLEGVEDFIYWVESGEWTKTVPIIIFPTWGEVAYEDEVIVVEHIHTPETDEMRAQGATEEEVYQYCLDRYAVVRSPLTP